MLKTLHNKKRYSEIACKGSHFFCNRKENDYLFYTVLSFYFFRGTRTLNVEPSPSTDSTVQLPPFLVAKS